MSVFREYAQYYNTLYREKNYEREANDIQSLLKRYGIQGDSIINFGCGTGKHDFALEKLGFTCCGIDISEEMISGAIQTARELESKVEFKVADIRKYRDAKKYSAVISLFHVMSYQNSNEDVVDTLKSAGSVLERGGLFLFDCWYGPGVLTELPEVRVKELEIENGRVIRIARPVLHPNQNVVDVNYDLYFVNETQQIKHIKEQHCMRYFFKPELEFILENAGFGLADVVDTQSLGEPTFDSWTAFFVARKL